MISILTRIVLFCLFLSTAICPFGYAAFGQTPGSLDTTFIKGAGADGFVRVVAVQPDGKVLAGGNFSMLRGVTNTLIARLNSDGTPDSGFSSAFVAPVLSARIYTLGIQTDGRILAAGMFTGVGGTFRTNIVRLQADGSVDVSFDSAAGPSGLVRKLVVQPDGRILIGGEFTTVNNTNRNRIARLNADGSLDASFDPGTGADNIVRTVARLPTGEVMVGGLFTSFDGRPANYLVRLNNDGTLDQSFPAGSGPNNNVYFIDPQAEGTILIGGDFTAVGGTNINRVARLRADGSVDDTFLPVGGALGGPVYHIVQQDNGKIVIGGSFSSVNGSSLNGLARLNADGSLDSGFHSGTGASDMVLTLAIQGDGRLVAGGLFATYDGTTVGMIARVYGDPVYPVIAAELPDSSHVLVSWPSWASAYALQTTERLQPADWQPATNSATLQGNRQTITLPFGAASQLYRLISR
jgi:uncharacterized delta-60 repeat protein